jgi:hypothetical protein
MSDDQKQTLPINNADVDSGNDIYDPDSKQWARKLCIQKNKCSIVQDSKAVAAEKNKANAGQFKKKKKKKFLGLW